MSQGFINSQNITLPLAVAQGGTGVVTSTGSGNSVLSTSPTLVTPALGTPASGVLTNCTGLPVAGGGTGVTVIPKLKAYRSAAQTTATATWTKIQFEIEDFDTNSNYDNVTNYRFTPTVAGKYLVKSTVSQTQIVGTYSLELAIYKNGSSVASQFIYSVYTAGTWLLSCTDIVTMDGGSDYLEAYWFQNSGGTRSLVSGAPYCNFEASLLV